MYNITLRSAWPTSIQHLLLYIICQSGQRKGSMPVFQKRRHGLGGKEAAKEATAKKPSVSGGADASSGFKNAGDE